MLFLTNLGIILDFHKHLSLIKGLGESLTSYGYWDPCVLYCIMHCLYGLIHVFVISINDVLMFYCCLFSNGLSIGRDLVDDAMHTTVWSYKRK